VKQSRRQFAWRPLASRPRPTPTRWRSRWRPIPGWSTSTTTRSCSCTPERCCEAPRTARLDYLEADLRDPEKILQGAARTLDFSRPVAVMLIAILHLIGDQDDPHGLVRALLAAGAVRQLPRAVAGRLRHRG